VKESECFVAGDSAGVGDVNAFVLKLDGVGGEDQQEDCQSADDFHEFRL
jgi:hypothetical protein